MVEIKKCRVRGSRENLAIVETTVEHAPEKNKILHEAVQRASGNP